MAQRVHKTFTTPEPAIQKLLEPAETFSNLITYFSIVAEITSLLAAIFLAILHVKKYRFIDSQSDLIELKRNQKNLQEKVNLLIAMLLGLAFIGASHFLL